MKLLSGLFDMLASKSDADASDLIEGLAKEVKEMKEKMENAAGQKPSVPYGTQTVKPAAEDMGKAKNIVSPDYKQLEVGVRPNVTPKEESGLSWGEEMPNVPNQYNSHKRFDKYFREIFQKNFPDYEITEEKAVYSRPSIVFTFWKDGKRALVVEVISQSTDVYKRRNECRRTGTPYLRYYHDYHGWWNTEEYVIGRTGKALALMG